MVIKISFFLSAVIMMFRKSSCSLQREKKNALCGDRGCPSVTYYQRLNRLPDVHKIRYMISLQKESYGTGGGFVKIGAMKTVLW